MLPVFKMLSGTRHLFQKYRHVDYVQFENGYVVDRFLNYWRQTGNQRIGIMFGTHAPHDNVPLGIKAVVAAIYEPPQMASRNSVELLDDENEAFVQELALKLGLRPVGWIFTDLIPDDTQSGKVKHFRGTIVSVKFDSTFSVQSCRVTCEASIWSNLVSGFSLPQRRGMHHGSRFPVQVPEPVQAGA